MTDKKFDGEHDTMALALNALDDVMRPVAQARGLCNAHYTDPQTFEIERQKLFFDNWAALGFAKDVPDPGCVKPVAFLGVPLLLVRTWDGSVNVYQNICRHRGMVLVDAPCRLNGSIRCPYHSWSYGLDGKLLVTPHVGGPGRNSDDGIDRRHLGLLQVRSHVWRDVVFVNLSGDAPAFEDYAAALIARWREFDHPVFHGGAESSFDLDVACNWKLAVENYCESYHLPWIHPGLNGYSRLEDHYHIEAPGCFSGQGTRVYRPMLADGAAAFVDFPSLSGKWDEGAEYIALYPNVLFGVHRDHVYTILLEAASLDRTVERIEIYYATPEMTGEAFAGLRARNAALWKGVFEEDIFVVEGMQRGRRALDFDGGRFSPAMDGPTHCFHHWVASKLAG